MRRCFPLRSAAGPAALAAALLALAAAAPGYAQEKALLNLLFDGQKAGTETWTREIPEKGIFRDTTRVEYKTPAGVDVTVDAVLTLQENEEMLRPVRFTLEGRSGGQAVSVQLAFEGTRARGTVRQGGQERNVDLDVGARFALLESNVYNLYRSMYRRYNFDRGGVQAVPVLVPSAAAVLEAQMERKGTARVRREGQTETLERLSVTLGDAAFDLYGTRGGRFLFLVCEEQALRAATPGYEDAALLPKR